MRLHDLGLHLVRLRSRIDFNTYLLRQRIIYSIGFVALPVGVASLLAPGLGLVLGVLGLLFSLISLVDAKRKRNDEKHRLHLVPGEGANRFAELRVPSGMVLPIGSGSVAVWPEVDVCLLRQQRVEWAWSPHPRRLPPNLEVLAYDLLLEQYKRSGQLFNGAVVRQDDDLTPECFRASPGIHLSKTRYFDLLCSNYQAKWDVRGRGGLRHLEGRSLIVDSRGMLRHLAENGLANVIGVSTVAVTTDGALVLVRQSNTAASSSNCIAPSGSGSMDLRDVPRRVRRGQSPSEDLAATVAAAMRRELVEEVNLTLEEAGHTYVTGYFRWLDQGAKPEYVGVTLLDVPRSTIEAREIRRVERAWVRDVILPGRRFDFARLRDDPDLARELTADAAQEAVEYISVPLVMAVRALGLALRHVDPANDCLTTALAERCLADRAQS